MHALLRPTSSAWCLMQTSSLPASHWPLRPCSFADLWMRLGNRIVLVRDGMAQGQDARGGWEHQEQRHRKAPEVATGEAALLNAGGGCDQTGGQGLPGEAGKASAACRRGIRGRSMSALGRFTTIEQTVCVRRCAVPVLCDAACLGDPLCAGPPPPLAAARVPLLPPSRAWKRCIGTCL